MTEPTMPSSQPHGQAWLDVIVGLGIAGMNADAAREVWQAAREEHIVEA